MTKREILNKAVENIRTYIRVAKKHKDTDFDFVLRILRDLSAKIDLLVDLDIISERKGYLLNYIIRRMILD